MDPPASRASAPASAKAAAPGRPEATSDPAAPELHLNPTGDTTYYHLELELRAADLITEGPMLSRDLAYQFSDGGMFEIYLRPERLGVPHPGCTNGLIVRMPWTNPDAASATEAVQGKRELFSALEQLRGGQSASQRVVLQLNPYIEVAEGDPQRVSLTQCTVFFRHAHEAYVDQVGPLRAEL